MTNHIAAGAVSFSDSKLMDAMDGLDDAREAGRSTLVSRNITVLGRRTSVRLEPEMWGALRDIAKRERCRIHDVCSLIQLRKNPNTSLTAAIRVFLMLYYRAATTEQGHVRAGHGDFNTMMTRAQATPDALHMRKRGRNGVNGGASHMSSIKPAQTPSFHSMQGL
ncbi:ribbon-helix-helix domain-containing protein [Micavibrio aeruginosavorus]|uniref:Uncharacterized domain protein n=1 Tax=Micavibrio aeruginosavorus (strain ARL-13) TaxID=856793 RepID=G2KND8_MICAA|nr:ribbon-helix-helix domain-containing protein [Micavibrio aeruginosavorus]AEP09786.1 putative uncharacterized domain protein [Micavibrio aeruginosavorus ARL-13]